MERVLRNDRFASLFFVLKIQTNKNPKTKQKTFRKLWLPRGFDVVYEIELTLVLVSI